MERVGSSAGWRAIAEPWQGLTAASDLAKDWDGYPEGAVLPESRQLMKRLKFYQGDSNMPLFIEKPAITSLHVEITPDVKNDFVDWQGDFNAKIANAAGFVSLEFSSSSNKKNSWLIVQRFINEKASSAWRNSDDYKNLINKLKTMILNKEVNEKENDESAGKGNITEVIVTQVSPGMEEDYRAWTAKIHQAEAKFPGFRGVYVQSPEVGRGKHWITLLQFDTMENLDCWLQSSERKQVLKRV